MVPQVSKQRYFQLSNQQQVDYNFVQALITKYAKTGTITSQDKVAMGIIARRLPDGDNKKAAIALHTHLMQQKAA